MAWKSIIIKLDNNLLWINRSKAYFYLWEGLFQIYLQFFRLFFYIIRIYIIKKLHRDNMASLFNSSPGGYFFSIFYKKFLSCYSIDLEWYFFDYKLLKDLIKYWNMRNIPLSSCSHALLAIPRIYRHSYSFKSYWRWLIILISSWVKQWMSSLVMD